MERIVFRSQIVLVDFDPVTGAEQGKTRPALIIQNDISNKFSPTTIVAPITSKIYPKSYPTNVEISPEQSGLLKQSTILLNQVRTIDKTRIIKIIGKLDEVEMIKVDEAIKVSLGLE